jgi:DNA-binding transcriptional LysR family regulator
MLNEISVFVRAVELKSLSAAARNVGITAAAASHRIKNLEDQVGARLLHRTTRNLQPTDAGRIFYQHALVVLAAVEDAKNSMAVASGTTTGQLRIGAPLHFGRRMLASMVSDFREQHPRVEVTLRLSDHSIDLLSEAVDVAVRLAINLPDSSYVVRKLADCPRLLCASPAYLERRGRPQTPEDLRGHDCLVLRLPGATEFRWTLTTSDGGAITLPVSGKFDADDGDVLTEWALRGEGIVLKPYWEVAEQIRRGELIPVLPDFPPQSLGLYLLYPHRYQLPAKVRIFSDFMFERTKLLLDQPGGPAPSQDGRA